MCLGNSVRSPDFCLSSIENVFQRSTSKLNKSPCPEFFVSAVSLDIFGLGATLDEDGTANSNQQFLDGQQYDDWRAGQRAVVSTQSVPCNEGSGAQLFLHYFHEISL